MSAKCYNGQLFSSYARISSRNIYLSNGKRVWPLPYYYANYNFALTLQAPFTSTPAFVGGMSGIFFEGPDKIGVVLKSRVIACVGHGLPLGEKRLRKIDLFFQDVGLQRDTGILFKYFTNVVLVVAKFVADIGERKALADIIVYILYRPCYKRRHNISGYVLRFDKFPADKVEHLHTVRIGQYIAAKSVAVQRAFQRIEQGQQGEDVVFGQKLQK